jgi:Dyp-type peroxidase family
MIDETPQSPRISHDDQEARTKALLEEGIVQPGIAFPSPSDQTQLLIVRINLGAGRAAADRVFRGLRRLCQLFADIHSGARKMDVLNEKTGLPEQKNLRTEFDFSATIGFGEGFFDLLQIPQDKRPSKLKTMPDHHGLGDVTPYSLGQSDMILQLGSSSSFANRWVLENTLEPKEEPAEGADPAPEETPPDIVSAVADWATITDVHAGFQRTDGRNLQGFNDGVSNPRAGSPQFDAVVWSTDETNPALNRGTYMVFQKVIHDLDQWRELDVDEQQEWVGRSKGTGLLLGTLDEDDDEELAKKMRAGDKAALAQWKKLFNLQSHPELSFFSPELIKDPLPPDVVKAGFTVKALQEMATRIANRCPAWSHVRKVNPRGADGADFRIMFRRGYPFMESTNDNKLRSGLLFVSFQNDIEARFEFIKSMWAGNPNFPVPVLRETFTPAEVAARRRGGRLTADELNALSPQGREEHGVGDPDAFASALSDAKKAITQQTGREGLAGPSEHGVTPTGEFLAIVPLGGGYYFVPPIPKGGIAEIGQQFFPEAAPTGPAGSRHPVAAATATAAAAAPAAAKRTPYKIVPLKGHPHKRRPQGAVAAAAAAAPAAGQALPLVFHGGALIANVEVFTVFLGAAWKTTLAATATKLNQFFDFILKSPLIDQLQEFSVPGFAIGHGKLLGTKTFPGALPHVMKNTRVQSTLKQLIASQQLPQPTANTLYFVFLPKGIVSELQGELSCQTFCGFHDSINGQIFYAVIPFATCAGCTRGFSIFDSLTRVASHELCEAITNPAEGGWFTEPPDGSPGEEIGDLCSEGTKKVGDFQVQTEFSNKTLSCK